MTISQMRQRIRRRRAVRAAGDGSTDQGVTLVEVVISIALMGIIVVPLLLAVSSSIRSSRVSESAAEVETLLVNAVDRVNRAPRAGTFACDLSSAVEAAVETVGWSPTTAAVQQEYLDISGSWVVGDSGTACPAGGLTPGLTQRITITITDPNERVSRTLQVVRGDI